MEIKKIKREKDELADVIKIAAEKKVKSRINNC